MIAKLKTAVIIFILLVLPTALLAQKDVTQFLGIPVDGYKPEMIKKLKDKGFTTNPVNEDVLEGEFNGSKVYIIIVTSNNKVWRIGVTDVNTMNESDIRVRYNNILKQFNDNKKYLPVPDSTLLKRTIPEDEDISYELTVQKKSYQSNFFQKTAAYDSLTHEINALQEKKSLNDIDVKQLSSLLVTQMNELYRCFNKSVWINLSERFGKYYITILYDNEYNKAKGEDL